MEQFDHECPVCLITLQPPTYQCVNGHLICGHCLTRIELELASQRTCPTCRVPYHGIRIRSLAMDRFLVEGAQPATDSGSGDLYVRVPGVLPLLISDGPSPSRSRVVFVQERAGLLDVVETRFIERCGRGRLKQGNWITLVDFKEAETVRYPCLIGPLRLGVYKTIAKRVGVYSSAHKTGLPSLILPAGTLVQIVEFQYTREKITSVGDCHVEDGSRFGSGRRLLLMRSRSRLPGRLGQSQTAR